MNLMLNLSAHKNTILIADDHQEILDFIADDLSDHYAVLQATNGQEALDMLSKYSVDLIVSDIMMPVLDGYDLCLKIKKSIDYCHIPFIMLTAKNSLQAKIDGLEHGADAYIEKPFSPSFLQAQIKSLLKNRQFIREHYDPSFIEPTEENQSITESDFLNKVQDVILEHMGDSALCVDMLAEKLHMSRPTLYRKIKTLSLLSPNELINVTRLKKAVELLNKGEQRIYEISAMVGFSSSSHFIRNFQKYYGLSPKEWKQQQKEI